MIAFSELNPIAIFIYYICVVIMCMFCINPITALVSLCFALALWFIKNGKKNAKSHLLYAMFFILISVLNPLFTHNGKTVLFVMNDNPVTLEALYFGITMALMIISTLYWCKSFSQIMTSDRLLYIFGRVSPKTALILSMTIRMIPLFKNQSEKTDNAQRAMGFYKDETFFSKLKGKIRVFSIMLTWAIENAVVTADSMSARGYSSEKRTSYALFRFGKTDAIFTAVTLLLSVPLALMIITGKGTFVFYPTFELPEFSLPNIFAYVCFFILCAIPFLSEAGDKIKWKYFQSTI